MKNKKAKSEMKYCKKCHKPLPEGYKHNLCEACRNNQAQVVQDVLKGAGGLAVGVASIALFVVTGGKISLKK